MTRKPLCCAAGLQCDTGVFSLEVEMQQCTNCEWMERRLDDLDTQMMAASEAKDNSTHEELAIAFNGYYLTLKTHRNRYHKNLAPPDQITEPFHG